MRAFFYPASSIHSYGVVRNNKESSPHSTLYFSLVKRNHVVKHTLTKASVQKIKEVVELYLVPLETHNNVKMIKTLNGSCDSNCIGM